jgi:ABC-type nitrate/sulfonate/bicarbonate transport system substrate-binding protein
MAVDRITVISFGGGFNLPLWAAQARGLFEHHGVSIALEFTADSRQVFRGLMQGDYHVAITALDNIVAHQEGHAEPVSDEAPDFFAFMGSDSGFLSLVSAPGVPDFATLVGRSVSVDDPANGFSMVLREMLMRHGLAPDAVKWERAGGTDRRYAALLEGRHAATMLRSPFDLLALQQGCHRLAVTREAIGPYMGIVGAARRCWAASRADALVGFIRAYRDAVQWLKAPSHRTEAQGLLRQHVPGMSLELAALSCTAMLDPVEGFLDDVRLDPAGVQAVLQLRSKHREPVQRLDDPGRYVDERYWRAA